MRKKHVKHVQTTSAAWSWRSFKKHRSMSEQNSENRETTSPKATSDGNLAPRATWEALGVDFGSSFGSIFGKNQKKTMTEKHVKNGCQKYRIFSVWSSENDEKWGPKVGKKPCKVWKADFHRTTIIDGLFAKNHMLASRRPRQIRWRKRRKTMQGRYAEKLVKK